MRAHPMLIVAAALVLVGCGDPQPAPGTESAPAPPPAASTTTAGQPTSTLPVPTTVTTTAPETTTSTVTTTPPYVGEWDKVVMELPVTPPCCAEPALAPVSPEGAIPDEGWPEDGFYDITARRLAEPPSTIELDIRRWVSCAEGSLPGCYPDTPVPGVTGDPTSQKTKLLDLNEDVTVVIWPVWEDSNAEPSALVGSGTDFAELLLSGIDHALLQWVWEPYSAGTPIETIYDDLIVRSADPSFPFAQEPTTTTFMYRGPHSALLIAEAWLLESADPWPPGVDGLYTWWTTLEIRDGKPVLYVYANLVAG